MKTPAPQTQAGRTKLASKGQALKDKSFPIPNLAYLKKAIRAKGRTPPAKWPALKALIRRRARELNATNAPGVKGTWAFSGGGREVIDLSDSGGTGTSSKAPKRMRGMQPMASMGTVQMHRAGPSKFSVTHAATGQHIGVLNNTGGAWTPVHTSGKTLEQAGSARGALMNLISHHNQLTASKPSTTGDGPKKPGVMKAKKLNTTSSRKLPPANKGGTASGAWSSKNYSNIQLATPATSSSSGPRMTTMSGSGLNHQGARAYVKARKAGRSHGHAMIFAKNVQNLRSAKAVPNAEAGSGSATPVQPAGRIRKSGKARPGDIKVTAAKTAKNNASGLQRTKGPMRSPK
jgi:hypothetical protein